MPIIREVGVEHFKTGRFIRSGSVVKVQNDYRYCFCRLCSLKKLCNELAQKSEEIVSACDNLKGVLVSQRTVRTDEAVRSCPSNIGSRRRKLKCSQEIPFTFVISYKINKMNTVWAAE